MLEETGDSIAYPSDELATGTVLKEIDSTSFASSANCKDNCEDYDQHGHCDTAAQSSGEEEADSDQLSFSLEGQHTLRRSNSYPRLTYSDDPLRKNPLSLDLGLHDGNERLLLYLEKNNSKQCKTFLQAVASQGKATKDSIAEDSSPENAEQISQCAFSTVPKTHISINGLPVLQSSSSSSSEKSIIKGDWQSDSEFQEYVTAENLNQKLFQSARFGKIRSASPTNSTSSMPASASAKGWHAHNDEDKKSIASDSLIIQSHTGSNVRRSLPKCMTQFPSDSSKLSIDENETGEKENEDSDDGIQFINIPHSDDKLEDDVGDVYRSDDVLTSFPPKRENVTDGEDVPTLTFNQSTGILPAIPSHKTRERSYLVGRLTKHGSLLGVDELHRYFPDRMLKIFVGTWNMQRKAVPKNLDDFLLPKHAEYLQDIYVIGVQEATQDQKMWEIKLQETLGVNHVLAHSVSHGVLHLSVFVRRDLIWFCSSFEDDKVTTRMVSHLKTKGAAAIGFHFFGTSLLFVNSHFHSGESKVKERVDDYRKIKEKIKLPRLGKPDAYRTSDSTCRYDCVFWFGDLNFRVNLPLQIIRDQVNNPDSVNIKEILKGDQLLAAMKRGKVFDGFKESPIKFRPTYKFYPGSDEYAAQPKLRTPSYTDRILFKCKENSSITCSEYNSVPKLKKSDHRPVHGFFEVCLKPGRDNIPYGLGKFRGDVYEKAARLRAQGGNYQNTSSVCNIL